MFETLFGSEMPLAARFLIALIVFIILPILLVAGLPRLFGLSKHTRPNPAMTADVRPASTEQLAVVEQRIANEDKNVALAYVLWFFIGTLGIHNFYIGRSDRGLAELILGFGGWMLVGAGTSYYRVTEGGAMTTSATLTIFGISCVLAWALMWLIDLFIIPSMVKKYRDKLRAEYIAEFTSDGPLTQSGMGESTAQNAWYYADRNGQVGPLSLQELRATLTTFLTANASEILVWHQGFPSWKPAKDVAELNFETSVPPPLPSSFTRNGASE